MVRVLLLMLWFAGAVPMGWRAFDIPSGSMVPTLAVGDEIMAETQGPFAPERGMLVLFHPPGSDEVYVKRVIGIGGDRVALRHGVVVLNGAALTQAREGAATRERLPGGRSHLITFEPGEGGLRDMAEVVVPAGTMFVLGDARDNSVDSRMAQVGFVPVARIVGVPAVRVWSAEHGLRLERLE